MIDSEWLFRRLYDENERKLFSIIVELDADSVTELWAEQDNFTLLFSAYFASKIAFKRRLIEKEATEKAMIASVTDLANNVAFSQ